MAHNDWTEVPLGKLITLEYGASLRDAQRAGTGYPVFGSNGQVGHHLSYLVEGPGIVVGRKGSVGAVTWSNVPFWPIDTTYYVRTIQDCDLRWLFWMLQSMELFRLDSSTGVPGLNRNDAYRMPVRKLSLPEQRGIAQILDATDEAIAKTEALIAKLKAIKQGLLHDLLTCGLDDNGELRDPERQPKQFIETPLGMRPHDWTLQRLGQMCDLLNGLAFKPTDWSATGLPIIRIQNLNRGEEFNYYDGFVADKYYIEPGTLLFSWSGNRGTSFGPFIWPGPRGILNQHIFKVTPKDGIRKRWFYYALDDVRQRVERIAHGGSGLVHIRRPDLCDYLIATPEEDEQERIEKAIAAQDSRIESEEAHLSKLKAIKKGLMQDLLTGRVRVTAHQKGGK